MNEAWRDSSPTPKSQAVEKLSEYYGTRKPIYRFHKIPPLVHVLCQMNAVRILALCTFLMSISLLPSRICKFFQFIYFMFPFLSSVRIFRLPARATCPAHLMCLDLITLTLLCLMWSANHAAPHSVFSILLLLHPSSVRSTYSPPHHLFSNTCSLCERRNFIAFKKAIL